MHETKEEVVTEWNLMQRQAKKPSGLTRAARLLRHGIRERTMTQQKYMKPPQENQQVSGLPLSTGDLFCKSFSIRRDVLDLTMAQWEIADSLDLTSITPRDWIRAIGARGGFLTALLTDEEREFVRIVYLPNNLIRM
jgi:hypothetical protein